MAISASQVKELRERTGVGLMECKSALQETSGDIEAAIDLLRKKGQLKAQKKAGRITAEGAILIAQSADKKKAVILEINCETDFVARDENFVGFSQQVTQHALAHDIHEVEKLMQSQMDGQRIEDHRQALITKTGENVQVRRLALLQTQHQIASYIHGDRIGVLVELRGGDEALGRDIAMHVAASAPLVIDPKDVSQQAVDKEKEIFMAQAQNSGKPAEIMEKMVQSRTQTFIQEVSLLGQAFVKDPKITVGKLLQNHNAEVLNFIRYAVGEGIEKKQENFAAEVMEQVKK